LPGRRRALWARASGRAFPDSRGARRERLGKASRRPRGQAIRRGGPRYGMPGSLGADASHDWEKRVFGMPILRRSDYFIPQKPSPQGSSRSSRIVADDETARIINEGFALKNWADPLATETGGRTAARIFMTRFRTQTTLRRQSHIPAGCPPVLYATGNFPYRAPKRPCPPVLDRYRGRNYNLAYGKPRRASS
jgi:hypothetical protein